jgi:hypothetical protein
MCRTMSQALSHRLYTVVEREKTPGIIKVKFGDIPGVITLSIKQLENVMSCAAL